jgi:hypothetical protein
MKTSRFFPVIGLVLLMVGSFVFAVESDRQFLRSEGTLRLGDAKLRALINAAKTTNSLPMVSVSWQEGDVTDGCSMPMKSANWFVFTEQTTRIWIFDGDVLSLVEKGNKTVVNRTVLCEFCPSLEAFDTCPKPVRDALPEKIRLKYAKQ